MSLSSDPDSSNSEMFLKIGDKEPQAMQIVGLMAKTGNSAMSIRPSIYPVGSSVHVPISAYQKLQSEHIETSPPAMLRYL